MVKFEALVAEVGLAVSAALRGLQRLRRLTEATHDGHAAQAQRVSVPEGGTWVQRDKCRKKGKKAFKTWERWLFSSELGLNLFSDGSPTFQFLSWMRGQQPAMSHVLVWGEASGRITTPK